MRDSGANLLIEYWLQKKNKDGKAWSDCGKYTTAAKVSEQIDQLKRANKGEWRCVRRMISEAVVAEGK